MEKKSKFSFMSLSDCLAGVQIIIFIGGLFLLAWIVKQQSSIDYFDMRGTVDTFTLQTADKNLSDQDKQKMIERFNDALDQSLTQWAESTGKPIYVKAAVVKGGNDITADIQADIARRMRTQ